MKPITIILTPAEYHVFKEAIARYAKATAKGNTIKSLIMNSICNEMLDGIEETEKEILAEDTEE